MSAVTARLAGNIDWRKPQKHLPRRGYCGVYYIRCGDYVKIGKSGDIQERVKDIARWNPYPVEVVAYEPCPGARAHAREAEIHECLSAHHHQGEWFRLSDEVEQFIRAKATKWPERGTDVETP